jgi:hypothetical protein
MVAAGAGMCVAFHRVLRQSRGTKDCVRRALALRLSAGETDLKALLPERWAASHPEHVLTHRLDESRRKAARQQAVRKGRRAARAKR